MQLDIDRLRFMRDSFSLEVSMRVPAGQTAVILGPSGCGKTTLLRLVAGLESPLSGSIYVGGRALDNVAPEKRAIGFVFQDLALFDHMTGKKNIAYSLALRGFSRSEIDTQVYAIAEDLKIKTLLDRRPVHMSGGERQRLAFARALVSRPHIMLLDEPLSSLDATLRHELRRYLRSLLVSRGLTALHVTHDIQEAFELADSIFLMRAGRIVAQGSPEALFASPPDAGTARFLSLGPLVTAKRAAREGGRFRIATDFGEFSLPAAQDRRHNAHDKETVIFFPRSALTICSQHKDTSFFARVGQRIFEGDAYRVSLHSTEGASSIEVVLPVDQAPLSGDMRRFYVDSEKILFFNKEDAK